MKPKMLNFTKSYKRKKRRHDRALAKSDAGLQQKGPRLITSTNKELESTSKSEDTQDIVQSMPPSVEVNARFNRLLDTLTVSEEEKINMRAWSQRKKWILICSGAAKKKSNSTRKVKATTEVLSQLKTKPTVPLLKELTMLIRTEAITWVNSFIDGGGGSFLMAFTRKLLHRTQRASEEKLGAIAALLGPCVGVIEAMLRAERGLEEVLSVEDAVMMIASCIQYVLPENRNHVLKALATLSQVHQKFHGQVLDILSHIHSGVIDCLNSHNEVVQTAALVLVNTLLLTEKYKCIEQQQVLGMMYDEGLYVIVRAITDTCSSKDLRAQIDIFMTLQDQIDFNMKSTKNPVTGEPKQAIKALAAAVPQIGLLKTLLTSLSDAIDQAKTPEVAKAILNEGLQLLGNGSSAYMNSLTNGDASAPPRHRVVEEDSSVNVQQGFKIVRAPKMNVAKKQVEMPYKKTQYFPSTGMRRLNWGVVQPESIKGSLWEQIDDRDVKIDGAKLEALFGEKSSIVPTAPKAPIGGQRRALQKQSPTNLLPVKRANDIGILIMPRFPKMHPAQIEGAILHMDRKIISPETLDLLIQYSPTKTEREMLQEYMDDMPDSLGKAEIFLLTMMRIDNLETRLFVWNFMEHFVEETEELKKKIKDVNKACNEVGNSENMAKILQLILALGNYINAQTKRGGAWGFKVTSMQAVLELKYVWKQGTLAHLLVEELKLQHPETLAVRDEMAHVRSAGKENVYDLAANVGKLKKGMDRVLAFYAKVKNSPVDEEYRLAIEEFVAMAEAQMNKLTERLTSLEQKYGNLLRHYGESPVTQSDDFFGAVQKLLDSLEQAQVDTTQMREQDKKSNINQQIRKDLFKGVKLRKVERMSLKPRSSPKKKKKKSNKSLKKSTDSGTDSESDVINNFIAQLEQEELIDKQPKETIEETNPPEAKSDTDDRFLMRNPSIMNFTFDVIDSKSEKPLPKASEPEEKPADLDNLIDAFLDF